MSMNYYEDHDVELWRYDGALSAFSEAAIVDGWLPTTGANWVDVTGQTVNEITVSVSEAEHGHVVAFTVAQESRLLWVEGKPMALVHSHWTPETGVSARATYCWGYLSGKSESQLDDKGSQRARRTFSFTEVWGLAPIPAQSLGRTNLMLAAAFDAAKSVTPLATPASEVVNGEYLSPPTSVDGGMAVDGSADTVAISSLIAELAPATSYGDTVQSGRPVPRAAMFYGGRASHVTRTDTNFIVLTCRAKHITWGDFETPAAVPNFYEEDDIGPIYPAQKNSTYHNTFFDNTAGRNGGTALRVRFKTGHVNPLYAPYIQWNTASTWAGLPGKVVFWVNTNDAPSVGKLLLVQLKGSAPEDTGIDTVITLAAGYQRYEVPFDTGRYGGVMMRFRAYAGEVAATDLVFNLDDLEVLIGYSDEAHAVATNTRYHFGWDDGIGNQGYMRVAFDLLPPGWVIPPGGLVILADDANALRARFDVGDAVVADLRARVPNFWFGPLSAAKWKSSFAQNPDRFSYSGVGAGTLIEELLFSGLNWTQGANPQAMVRQTPLFTGSFVAVDYPTLNIDTATTFGPSYWTYDLKAYTPPALTAELSSTGNTANVEDTDHYGRSPADPTGVIQIDNELIAFTTVDDGTLALSVRGYNPAGAPFVVGAGAPALHAEGALVYPWRGGSKQYGQLVADVELRRKPGTARIQNGFVLYSNEIAPPNPYPAFERTVGGAWKIFGRFANNQAETVRLTAPVPPYVEARWLCYGVDHMEYRNGKPSRGKLNEARAFAYRPGASVDGGYHSRAVGNVADAVGYLLVTYSKLPAAKYLPTTLGSPVDFLPIGKGYLDEALTSAAAFGGLVVLADGLGRVRLVAKPGSAYFVPGVPTQTWDTSKTRGGITVKWQRSQEISQVVLVAREVAALRTHVVRYPDIAAKRGKVLDVKDIAVASIEMARAHARALFSQGNAQRVPPLTVGYVPGLSLYDRHVVNLADADLGSQIVGVNTYVTGYVVTIKRGKQGSLLWQTQLDLTELAL